MQSDKSLPLEPVQTLTGSSELPLPPPPVPEKDTKDSQDEHKASQAAQYDNDDNDDDDDAETIVFDNSRVLSVLQMPLPETPSKPDKPAPTKKKNKPKLREMTLRDWLKCPLVVWVLTAVQVVVFFVEFVRMGVLTGSPVQTKPAFNPMVGPSTYVLINMGARFTPCMHAIPDITSSTVDLKFPCPNSTTLDTNVCSLSELCGMGGTGTAATAPHQWWRFITPLFLHAGFVHLGFNLLLQLTMGSAMEREIGHARFLVVYLASGIAGFVLGGNFAPDGVASTGASGALFGIIALDFLDLLFNWHQYVSPKRALLVHLAEIVVSFGIGLLPGLDNFSHIGGFAMGLLLGTALLTSPLPILRRQVAKQKAQGRHRHRKRSKVEPLDWLKHPRQNLKHQPLAWHLWVLVRLAAIALAIVYMVVLLTQFESSSAGEKCSWCKYLSCIPVNGWCDLGNIELGQPASSSSSGAYAILAAVYLLRWISNDQ